MESKSIPMKLWSEDEQPRERLLQHGVASLSLNELFAILLRSGGAGESALGLSRKILLDCHNDLNELARVSVQDLVKRYKGIGLAKAAAIVAAMEIGRRRKLDNGGANLIIRSSRDVYDYISPRLMDLDHEEFWVIYLSQANRIKGCESISVGGVTGTLVDVRVLFKNALLQKTVNMIVAHNHPGGGVPRPSREDELVTRKIYEAGKLLDIKLFDHLIISGRSYYSFADEGNLMC